MSKYRIIECIRKRASRDRKRIVFPETKDSRVLQAAEIVSKEGIAHPVLVGNPQEVGSSARSLDLSLSGVEVCEPDADARDRYAAQLLEKWRARGTTLIEARQRLEDPVFFAAAMVAVGDADGCVGDGPYSDFKRATELCIGPGPQTSIVSRYFLMAVPPEKDGETEALLFADSGTVGTPSGAQLAAIAIDAAANARRLLECEPRVAFLSFSPVASLDFKSRFKSAESELHDRVRQAFQTLRVRAPGLTVDGELRTNIGPTREGADGTPAGCGANTLVFPDTEAGNLGHRLTQRLGGARAVGPVFQGLARPANHLPPRYSSEDAVDLTAITGLLASGTPQNTFPSQ